MISALGRIGMGPRADGWRIPNSECYLKANIDFSHQYFLTLLLGFSEQEDQR